jgi:TadE-like protein
MTEFIIVFPVLFILIFAAFQFTLLYHAKITLNYATFLAARSGAVSNGHIGIMENALARGMAPLYTHCDDPAEVIRAREQVRKEIESGFAWIEIINPDVDTAFGSAVAPLSSSSTLSSTDGSKPLKISIDGTIENVIPNDNLMFRPTTSLGGLSIQDRNLLKIRTHYCYPLYVPFIDTLLVNIMTLPPNTDKSSPDYCPECQGLFPEGSGTFEDGCLKNGRFPINSQAIVRMQSPAIKSAMTPTTANSSYPGPATDNTNIPLALTLTTVCPAATP